MCGVAVDLSFNHPIFLPAGSGHFLCPGYYLFLGPAALLDT